MTSSKTWMITGASSGLGRALVARVLAAGHTVVATVRPGKELPTHDRLTVLPLDVRDRGAARAAVETAAASGGGLDVLVNNAGYGLIGAVEEVSEDEVRAVVETDMLGPLWLSQAVVPLMRARGSGRIVQISTVGGVGVMPLLGLYNASKWGFEAFSEALAAEVRGFGVRVSIIQPGALDTDWAGSNMRFAQALPVYDDLRTRLFGRAEIPWPASSEPTGGTRPEDAAEQIFAHVCDDGDERLRVLIGEDAPVQVRAALDARLADYARDPRFPTV
ncbi:SDR family NAD(P)-dependent oxidoreductase [Microbacterium sp. KSW4-17]|uniref:SDR family NAD(P)-dependent oxidoreductase n=1 Tax=Microbacterium galbum TaxID=3075994 RepID=A0ABU3T562_9MICO|nr:SDR family NAD(P)-dependent oxidoreductase [Microbacterium sp. KSW4-17]MDU0366450.1 SDR family NAD(P)-dependent oxidoreductase [Microbacterium sp. KSW4-17]